jgi:hypothetical protein
MAYGLLRNNKVKHTLQDAQITCRERLQMWVDSIQQYIELKEKVLEVCDYQTPLQALNQLVKHLKIFEHCHAIPLLEVITTSLGNWSYVLRALELKVKLAGKERFNL